MKKCNNQVELKTINQNPIFDESSIKHLESEQARLSSLELPAVIHTISENFTPHDIPTAYLKFSSKLDQTSIQYSLIAQVYNEQFSKLINKGLSQNDANEILNALQTAHSIVDHSIFVLAKNIGEHNKEYELKKHTEIGKKRSISESEKTKNNYLKKYQIALNIMRDILRDFYKDEKNHEYKSSLVIKLIEDICIDNRIPFPKTTKSTAHFKRYLSLIGLPKSATKTGAPKAKFKIIDENEFKNRYIDVIKKYSSM
jgi:hypothetical protein